MEELTDKIITYLEKHLDRARYKHTLGTCKIVRELAKRNNVPEAKAMIAGLLHDAGKGYKKPEMVKYVAKHRVKVPYKKLVIEHNPSLLHSYISADIAKRKFGIKDNGILKAITLHTLGGENMPVLAKIVYVADSVAFDRRYTGVKELRELAYKNLDSAVKAAMANKLYYVIKNNKWLHPGALKAWNYAISKIKSKK